MNLKALILFLLLPLYACGQEVEGRYYMVGSFEAATLVADSTYRVNMLMQTDQSGSGYLANQAEVGYRIFTNTRNMYRIDTVHSSTFSSADLSVTRILGTGGPNGIGMLYEYDGTTQSLPVPPVNSTGISAAMASIIQTHNARVSGELADLDYGRIRFVNKTFGNNETARIGDPYRPWKDPVAACYAPDQRAGDVIYTYDSDYNYTEFSLNPEGNPLIENPRDSLTFFFDRVSITGNLTSGPRLIGIDIGPNGLPITLTDSTRYTINVKGTLTAIDYGIFGAWNVPAANNQIVDPPLITANIDIKDFITTNGQTAAPYVAFSDGGNTFINARVERAENMRNELINLARWGGDGSVFRNKKLSLHVREMILRKNPVYPALMIFGANQKPDSCTVVIRVDEVKVPKIQPTSGSQRGYHARLWTMNRGTIFTNSNVNISLGTVTTIGLNDSTYAGQPVKDFADTPYAGGTLGENARLGRINGNLTGSKIMLSCELCDVEDGFLLIDQPTGGGDVYVTGTYHSREQSVVKFGNQSANSLNVHLNGNFNALRAPAISSSLTVPTSVAPVRMTGSFATSSTSFPVIALNRQMRIYNAYFERPFSSGSRPVIESNSPGTILQHVGVGIISAGNAVGPNITASAMPTIPN